MEKFVAYFDILGFAKFLENNDKAYINRILLPGRDIAQKK